MMFSNLIRTVWYNIQVRLFGWYVLTNIIFQIDLLTSDVEATGLQTSSHQFVNKPLCNVADRLAMGCMVPANLTDVQVDSQHANSSNSTSSSNSAISADLLLCAIECANDGSCVGCSRYSSDSTQAQWQFYKHWPCDRVFSVCSDGEEGFQYFPRYVERTHACQNGGVWDEVVNRCSCASTEVYVGEFCQRRAKNCAEFEASGYSSGYQYRNLSFSGSEQNALVICWLYGEWGNNAMVTLYRRPVREYYIQGFLTYDFVDYNMTWAEQEAGYWTVGTLYGWVGLRNFAQIVRYNKPMALILRINVGDSQFEQTYYDFELAEETYALTYDSVSLTRKKGTTPLEMPGACFPETLKGANFSTWDKDNDDDPNMNCAAEAGGGWWYQSCDETCNFFQPGYDMQNPEPETYTRVKIPGLDIRAWANSFGPVSLVVHDFVE